MYKISGASTQIISEDKENCNIQRYFEKFHTLTENISGGDLTRNSN